MSQESRSDTLIEVLEHLQAADADIVLVGGYAISQFETRFSTDLDLVIAPEDYEEVVEILETHHFRRETDVTVPQVKTNYDRDIEVFERSEGVVHPVGVDLLVNGLGCRQTGAEWSYTYLREHSSERMISGGTQSTIARVADGNVLVAAKLHSGRPTDLADVLAAVPELDFDAVENHLNRGDENARRSQLQKSVSLIEEGGLDHRFKSLFGQSSVSMEHRDMLLDFLEQQLS